MNNKEAIRRIEEHKSIHFAKEYPRAIKITEALNMAIKALEKATPKKPTKTTIDEPVLGECVYETYDAYKCPICGKMIAVDYYGLDYRDYCQFCGQAIDWSEDDGQ